MIRRSLKLNPQMQVMEMCLEIYKRPRELMEDISAIGLRHVGYGIPTELFMPFVEAGKIREQALFRIFMNILSIVAISQNPCTNDAVSCQAWSQAIYAMTLGISWHKDFRLSLGMCGDLCSQRVAMWQAS